MKTVGKRKPATDIQAAEKIQQLARDLRSGRPFIPRGVYRFKTFEEAQKWSIEMQARPVKKTDKSK